MSLDDGWANRLAAHHGGVPGYPANPETGLPLRASSPTVRRRMQGQRSEGTGPELALRRELHRLGLRYRLHRAIVPGTRRKVDIVFGPAKVAVFVDGCYWHGCPEHGRREHKINGWYWGPKIERNQRRDQDTIERLEADGWAVIRVWEHEDPGVAAKRVKSVVSGRRVGAHTTRSASERR